MYAFLLRKQLKFRFPQPRPDFLHYLFLIPGVAKETERLTMYIVSNSWLKPYMNLTFIAHDWSSTWPAESEKAICPSSIFKRRHFSREGSGLKNSVRDFVFSLSCEIWLKSKTRRIKRINHIDLKNC